MRRTALPPCGLPDRSLTRAWVSIPWLARERGTNPDARTASAVTALTLRPSVVSADPACIGAFSLPPFRCVIESARRWL